MLGQAIFYLLLKDTFDSTGRRLSMIAYAKKQEILQS